jgi:hypothetical protein
MRHSRVYRAPERIGPGERRVSGYGALAEKKLGLEIETR